MLVLNSLNEKLPMVVIGKSKSPRCLKQIDIKNTFGIYYYANKSAWMTREIFSDYILKLNNYFREQNKKILLVMDNFSGHLINEPSNIEFCFLPPNTTSLIQPLD